MEFRKWLESAWDIPTKRGIPAIREKPSDPQQLNYGTRAINAMWKAPIDKIGELIGGERMGDPNLTKSISNVMAGTNPDEQHRQRIEDGEEFAETIEAEMKGNEAAGVQQAYKDILTKLEKIQPNLVNNIIRCKSPAKTFEIVGLRKVNFGAGRIKCTFAFPKDPSEITC